MDDISSIVMVTKHNEELLWENCSHFSMQLQYLKVVVSIYKWLVIPLEIFRFGCVSFS